MAINKKLIHFKSKQKFNEELANGNILETSIVFIQDSKEIYTHGTLYDGKSVDLSDVESLLQDTLTNYATKEELDNAFEVYIGEEEPTSDTTELWIDESEEWGSSESGIDTEMSDVSTNVVQNRVIKEYIDSVVGNINTILDNINGEEI